MQGALLSSSLHALQAHDDRALLFMTGVNMKDIFWLGIVVLMQKSRSRFKQSRISLLNPHIYVLGRFVNILVIFRHIWR